MNAKPAGDGGGNRNCPRCGEPSGSGPYCTACGVRVVPGFCPECGEGVDPGDRFCGSCGGPLGATAPAGAAPEGARQGLGAGGAAPPPRPAPRGGASAGSGEALGRWNALWVVGLVGFVGAVLFLTADIWRGGADAGAVPGAAAPGGLGPAPQVDLASMTPREAADRLFNRVVEAAELGDSTEVQTFISMALSAYEIARPLDTDGEFHLTVLQRIAAMNQEALVVADSMLASDPNHLLLLSSAAEAARELGDSARAAGYYQRILDVYEEESNAGRQEYLDHPGLIPQMPDRAREFLAGSGGTPEEGPLGPDLDGLTAEREPVLP